MNEVKDNINSDMENDNQWVEFVPPNLAIYAKLVPNTVRRNKKEMFKTNGLNHPLEVIFFIKHRRNIYK